MRTLLDLFEALGLLTMLTLTLVLVRRTPLLTQSRLLSALLTGLSLGLLSAIVMLDPIRLPEGATIDPRAAPAILAGVFAGPVGAAVAALVGGATRYFIVGGPVALGGAVGFALYGLFGWLAGVAIRHWRIEMGIGTLALLGLLGTIAVLPSFFVSVDWATGLAILRRAGPLLLVANVAGTILVGYFVTRAIDWVDLRTQLDTKNTENETLALALRAANPVLITDRGGLVEWANEGFTRLTGYSLDEARGRRPGDFLQGPDTDPATRALMRERIAAGEGFDVEVVNYSRTGRPYWINITCSPIRVDGQTARFVAIQNEITARVEAQAALFEAKREAERASRIKSEFLAAMSHELRTPMNAILGFAQLLQLDPQQKLTLKEREYLEHIDTAGQHLLALINDVLDLARVEARRLPLTITTFLARDVIRDSVAKLQPLAAGHDVTIDLPEPALAATLVRGDAVRLRQVVINLVANAVKYNRRGGRVEIAIAIARPGFLRISVRDTGIGIPADKQPKLFRFFSRVNADPLVAGGGAGIGLAVSKSLMELMGGGIGFVSAPDAGSTFWVDLPLADNRTVLVWDEHLRLGVDAIDADHQQILARINHLSAEGIPPLEFGAAVAGLQAFIAAHFAREEFVMAACGHPEQAGHARYHRDFLDHLQELLGRWNAAPEPAVSEELRRYLCDWWANHIDGSDRDIFAGGAADGATIARALAEFAARQGAGAAAEITPA